MLLALHKRVLALEEAVAAGVRAGLFVAAPSSTTTEARGQRRWRPDRCAHLYGTYDPEALNPPQVQLLRCGATMLRLLTLVCCVVSCFVLCAILSPVVPAPMFVDAA